MASEEIRLPILASYFRYFNSRAEMVTQTTGQTTDRVHILACGGRFLAYIHKVMMVFSTQLDEEKEERPPPFTLSTATPPLE